MKTIDIIYRYESCECATRSPPPDGPSALLRLNEGNRAFATLLEHITDESGTAQQIIPVDPRDLGLSWATKEAPKQHPFAVVLGCSDARVPVELIFNEGPNDLFVIRVAGNGLGGDVLGSLKYAVENLRGTLKLIAVLGHSGCGAVTSAVDVFLRPADYLAFAVKHSLRGILDRLLLVVQTSARRLAAEFGADVALRPGYREALIEASIVTNAALTAYSIQEEFGIRGDIRTVYGVYLLETRAIWAPRSGNAEEGLAPAPKDIRGFIELGNALVHSDRIASCIGLK